MQNPDSFVPSEASSRAFFSAIREAHFCDESLTPLGGLVELRADGTREVTFAAETTDPGLPKQQILFEVNTNDNRVNILVTDKRTGTVIPLTVDPTRRDEMNTLLDSLQPAKAQLPAGDWLN
ncbi:MAG: hypothetical protein Q8L37_03540 [Candidatus Gottesmanbacteria bacterium]|nr:hypothetical protein [Candidatus Gottesmanbacteria bacterium]